MKLAAFLFTLVLSAHAQNFSVSNPKNLKYNELEAVQAYAAAVLTVEQEYHSGILSPRFELVLGDEDRIHLPSDAKRWSEAKVSMKTWSVRTFRAAVIVMAINELLRPENVRRLEARIESESKAMIPVEQLKR